MSTSPSNPTLTEDWGERISAYVDGELSPADAAAVEQRLASDPEARRLADELRAVGDACRLAPAPAFNTDLSQAVLAEALRRQSEGRQPEGRLADEDALVERLEPEGEYGLPFGKASRGWSWMGVAVAAALLISFYGRPNQPSGAPTIAKSTPAAAAQQRADLQRLVAALRQASPAVQVRNVVASPAMVDQLRQRFAMQSPQRAQLPNELMTVSQRTGMVVEAADPQASPVEQEGEELLYVDASEEEIDQLLADLQKKQGGELFQVEGGREPSAEPAAAPAPQRTTATPPRAVRIRLQLKPGAKLLVSPDQAATASQAAAPGRKLVVLRIKVRPQP